MGASQVTNKFILPTESGGQTTLTRTAIGHTLRLDVWDRNGESLAIAYIRADELRRMAEALEGRWAC